MFAAQAHQRPQQLAIATELNSLTYQQLSALSCAVGRMLLSEGTSDSYPIAVLISDQSYFAAAILGVLRIGRFYSPLDPSYPLDRNLAILRESGSKTILTCRADQGIARQLASEGQQLIYVDDSESEGLDPPDESRPDTLAYVIFTSGSTGVPKGVMQTQRNVLEVARRYINCLCLGSRDSVGLLSSCSVTASVPPLMSSLITGATVHGFSVLSHGLPALADWIDTRMITVYDSAPSLFRHLMKNVSEDRIFKSLQIVRLASDAVYKSDWDLFVKHCGAEAALINVYGCSEVPTVAAFYADKSSRIADVVMAVGHALGDVEILLSDENGSTEPVPSAESQLGAVLSPGEIVLRSLYVSPGYWDRAEGLKPEYIDTPGMARNYRTGDLGAVRGNQGLVHLGRLDLQAKLSGFRVEVGEIEAYLRACPGVADAAVVAHTTNHGENVLVAFVVRNATEFASSMGIRSCLEAKLPRHMVPSHILFIDSIPSTPNGKIDRAGLVALRDRELEGKSLIAAGTPTESALCDIWMKLLERKRIGIRDDFFELDGNSLLAMRLLARLEEEFDIQLDVSAIFRNPTVAQLATLIDRLLAEETASLE